MLAWLTGLGLSTAAGLNAYIPLLVVGVLARFTDVIALPPSQRWLASGWVLGIGAVLLVCELVLDKVPVVDHLKDAVQTFIRPAVGGAVFTATAAAQQADASQWLRDHPWVGWLLGVVVAGLVHTGKVTARPVVNVSTVGLGTPVVSTAEDLTSLGMSLAAVFAPLLALVLVVALAWTGTRLVRGALRRRRQSRGVRQGPLGASPG
jgi:peptidoglycan/LPS O-acetylase OafA/YrhL